MGGKEHLLTLGRSMIFLPSGLSAVVTKVEIHTLMTPILLALVVAALYQLSVDKIDHFYKPA